MDKPDFVSTKAKEPKINFPSGRKVTLVCCCLTFAIWNQQTCRADGTNLTDTLKNDEPPQHLNHESFGSSGNLWVAGVGSGLWSRTSDLELSVGSAFGLHSLVGHKNHDLALMTIDYGQIMGDPMGGEHWYRGNWELVGEVFGGGQYRPKTAYLLGFTPLIRYNFATGTRLLPFIEGGFGPTATDIGRPDLATTFEFNIQGTMGVHYLWNEHHALTLQCRYMHLSNAGIKQPNAGVNTVVFLAGTSWFF